MKSKRKNQKVGRGNSPASSPQIKSVVTPTSPPVKPPRITTWPELFQYFTDQGYNQAIMEKTGLRKSQLSRWSEAGNVCNPGNRLGQVADATPGDDALQLCLAEHLDCTLVPNPKPGAPAPNLPAAGDDAELHLAEAITYIVKVKHQPPSRERAVELHRLGARAKVWLEIFTRAYDQKVLQLGVLFYPLLAWFTTGELALAEV